MRYFSSRNAVCTRVAHSTSSFEALTYFTIVVICPLSSSFFCIIALIGSSSLRSTHFQRAYSPLMQNGAFSASPFATTRTPLPSPARGGVASRAPHPRIRGPEVSARSTERGPGTPTKGADLSVDGYTVVGPAIPFAGGAATSDIDATPFQHGVDFVLPYSPGKVP